MQHILKGSGQTLENLRLSSQAFQVIGKRGFKAFPKINLGVRAC
jgi:hypothetical protein